MRLKADNVFGFLRASDGAMDVSCAGRGEFGSWRIGENFVQHVEKIEQARFDACADVENFPCGVWVFGGDQVGADNIMNIDEVAGLSAIAKDSDRFAVQQSLNEDRDSRGVHRVGSLARTVHVEIAERDNFKIEFIRE